MILALATWIRPEADEDDRAAPGSFRAAQELGFDASLRPVDLLNVEPGSAPSGSFRAAQDRGITPAWSGFYDYQGPGTPPAWAGDRDQLLDWRSR